MTSYLICASILFTFMSIIWSSNGAKGLNLLLKMVFIGMTVWTLFNLLGALGYIVKV